MVQEITLLLGCMNEGLGVASIQDIGSSSTVSRRSPFLRKAGTDAVCLSRMCALPLECSFSWLEQLRVPPPHGLSCV